MVKVRDAVGFKGTVYVISKKNGLLWCSNNMIVDEGLAALADAINPDGAGFSASKIWVTNSSATPLESDTAHDFCDMNTDERLELDVTLSYKSGRNVYYIADAGAFGNFSWKKIGLLTSSDTLIGQVAYTLDKTVDTDVDICYVLEVRRAST